MALMLFLQDDKDVLSVYRNLKIFCETVPRAGVMNLLESENELKCKNHLNDFIETLYLISNFRENSPETFYSGCM